MTSTSFSRRSDPPRHPEWAQRERLTAALPTRMARTTDETKHPRLRDEVVVLNMRVATAIAARYRRRGVAREDLEQVAYLALVKAARGYDASMGHDFLCYAVPTIRGELKKYFRDQGWSVRPPRRVQDLRSRIGDATDQLTHALGRSPRVSEIADHLNESVEDVAEAMAAQTCFHAVSLDRPAGIQGPIPLTEGLGGEDPGQRAAEARVVLAPLVSRLADRDRRIVVLRFFHGQTQQEIARDLGVTQMQVSRLLSSILRDLRASLGDEPVSPSAQAELGLRPAAQERPCRDLQSTSPTCHVAAR